MRLANFSFAVSSNRNILSIFKFETQEDCDKLVYYTFLSMARAGIVCPLLPLFRYQMLTTGFSDLWSGTTPRRRGTVRRTWSQSLPPAALQPR